MPKNFIMVDIFQECLFAFVENTGKTTDFCGGHDRMVR